MKIFLKGESGFSLVQAMIISAVLMGSGLVATQLMTDQKLAQKNAETRDQVEDLHTVLYSILQNRDNCKATLEGFQNSALNSNLLNPSAPKQLRAIYNWANPSNPVYERYDLNNKTYMNGNVLIKSMDMVYNANDTNIVTQGKATVTIVYERQSNEGIQAVDLKRTKKGYGAKEIRKTMDLRMQRDPFVSGKPVTSCYAYTQVGATTENSQENGNDISKAMCLEMNNGTISDGDTTGLAVFVWDEQTSTCIPNAKCPDHMIFTGIDSAGDVKCRQISEWFDFNQMIDPNISSGCVAPQRVRFHASSDNRKISIECY